MLLPHSNSNGFDVLRDLRRRGIETPLLMLSVRTQAVDRVVGFKLGADDYRFTPDAGL